MIFLSNAKDGSGVNTRRSKRCCSLFLRSPASKTPRRATGKPARVNWHQFIYEKSCLTSNTHSYLAYLSTLDVIGRAEVLAVESWLVSRAAMSLTLRQFKHASLRYASVSRSLLIYSRCVFPSNTEGVHLDERSRGFWDHPIADDPYGNLRFCNRTSALMRHDLRVKIL